MPTFFLWTLTIIPMLLGLAGTIIPGLPGVGLIYLAILFYAIATSFTSISLATVVILGLLSIAALAANYAGSAFGSRYGGGKKWALAGTLIGAVAGAGVGPLGIFIGAFLGALVGALLEGASHKQALTVAAYSVIGIIGSTLVQFLLAVILIITFFFAIIL